MYNAMMRKIFEWANARKRAIVAFNISNMETIQGVTAAAAKLNCPAILQVSAGARKYADPKYLLALFNAAKAAAPAPLILHLDHGDTFELCKECIDGGFDSVMFDGSGLPFEENISLTKKVVGYAHKKGVWVEGELGQICGIEDDLAAAAGKYTDPAAAKEFVARTGVDSLAISIGTAHGAHKYAPNTAPKLRLDILKKIHKLLPNTPLVLHGASSVIPEYTEMINRYGGEIKDAFGMPETEIAKTIAYGVRKINIDSDIRLAITAAIRRHLHENPAVFDPRSYLKEARAETERVATMKLKHYTCTE
jgi:fructose-bisphosphate aldolase class II